jgi:beta-galactosidase/beta-glucuronidase
MFKTKKVHLTSLLLSLLLTTTINAQWQPAGNKIKTNWATQINVDNVLPDYPRPIMERTEWQNLNGLWDYAILPQSQPYTQPDGQILVPFAVESSLSGVQKTLNKQSNLWYNRRFTIPAAWKGKKVILHFGAVDWETDVWVNDIKVGNHTGGYTPFSFDITAALNAKGDNRLTVRVWDPTDESFQARGKQNIKPHGIWYTPVSGIWQTVWLEPVAGQYIQTLKITPNIDNGTLKIEAEKNTSSPADLLEVKVFDGTQPVAVGKSIGCQAVEIAIPDAKLWSPDDPFLYTLQVTLFNGGKAVDAVKSYAAMRKYSIQRDAEGIVRLQLNNRPLFQFGPLDQGWWPDGLYTAPTDEALKYDILKTKTFGFNMIRKHVKVEPARWYTHCDRLGVIVWQDMPNGDKSPHWQNKQYFNGAEITRSAQSEFHYRKEWKEIIDCLYSYPCIGVWVPFNEAWGQFKTCEIVEWTQQYDPSRLVNPASGGNHYTCGDMLDLHNYPAPDMYLYDAQRPTVLGEYGGIGLVMKEHLWEPNRNWGYVQFANSKEATDEYIQFAEKLQKMIAKGFSAAVYTQTTDVEIEVNGLMTYDRKVVKLDESRLQKINREICNSLK